MAQIPEAAGRIGASRKVGDRGHLGVERHGVGPWSPSWDLSSDEGTNGVTYDVVVDLDRTVSGLLPGMSSTVVF